MANFATHLYGAAAVSSVGALACHTAGWADQSQTQTLFLLGVAGGLLPDIDSDSSTPIRAFFTLLGAVLGFAAGFAFVGQLAPVELGLVWLGVFLAVRYGVLEIFARFTVHRGLLHSLLAAVFMGMAAVHLSLHWLGIAPQQAWLNGLFITLGYLTHLVLDELYSVNLLNARVKRSFGTALKPLSLRAPWASMLMVVAVAAMAYTAPRPAAWQGTEARLAGALDARELTVKWDRAWDWLGGLRWATN